MGEDKSELKEVTITVNNSTSSHDYNQTVTVKFKEEKLDDVIDRIEKTLDKFKKNVKER